MKILGIIVEYNPMHNGHIYQIKKAKELVNPDYTVVIMSGCFTEQGNISLIDKFKKAEIAIENEASLVIELPTIYATSSAEYFAGGAIDILNSMNCITHLAFGAECADLTQLKNIAHCLNTNEQNIILNCIHHSDKSIAAPVTTSKILNKYLCLEELEILKKPNNILAIQYLRCLQKLKSNIIPVVIQRGGVTHNSCEIHNNIASSTKIRTLFDNKEFNNISNLVPFQTYNSLLTVNQNYKQKLWDILKYEIIKLQPLGLRQIFEISEGLENRFYKYAEKSYNYDEFLNLVNTKRYTLGRIKRICVNILLSKTKETFDFLKDVQYVRVLKTSPEQNELLSIISSNSSIPVITKLSNYIPNNNLIKKSLELDILATKIHNIIFNNSANDLSNPIK